MAISVENRHFSKPCILHSRWRVPLGTGYQCMGSKKLVTSDGTSGPNKKYDDIFSRLDTIHQRDVRTDTGRQKRPHLRIASRGKNAESFHLLLRVRPSIGMLCAWLTWLPLQVTYVRPLSLGPPAYAHWWIWPACCGYRKTV